MQASPRASKTAQLSSASVVVSCESADFIGRRSTSGSNAPGCRPQPIHFDCQGNSSTFTLRETLIFYVKPDGQAGVTRSSAFLR